MGLGSVKPPPLDRRSRRRSSHRDRAGSARSRRPAASTWNTLPRGSLSLTQSAPPWPCDDLATDRQAESHAASTGGASGLGLIESCEHAFLLVVGNSRSFVRHRHQYRAGRRGDDRATPCRAAATWSADDNACVTRTTTFPPGGENLIAFSSKLSTHLRQPARASRANQQTTLSPARAKMHRSRATAAAPARSTERGRARSRRPSGSPARARPRCATGRAAW